MLNQWMMRERENLIASNLIALMDDEVVREGIRILARIGFMYLRISAEVHYVRSHGRS